ncbi:MAG: DEAD/DEAH box helicase family protein, partial [Cyclobacteriaceae bacterium]
MVSNFQFLSEEWPSLHNALRLAEERVYVEPMSTAGYCRTVIEECIYHIYQAEQLEIPYNTDLFNLLKHRDIEAIIPYHIRGGVHYARKIGNAALHYNAKKINGQEALTSLKYTYSFVKWFANYYSQSKPELPGSFDETHVPVEGEKQRLEVLLEEQKNANLRLAREMTKLKDAREEALALAKESKQARAAYHEGIRAQKVVIERQKEGRAEAISSEFTEAETRKHLIDAALMEAGWDELRPGRELEYPLVGMPKTNDNPNGNGFADYVLWDDNGKPLAVIEAKRTTVDEETGRHQASLYASCLEQMYGQRPVIFYSNGYVTKLWDDTFYSAPRRTYGFYTKSELQWVIQQRQSRLDLRTLPVNMGIAGRPYQIEAIQRIAETFVVDANGSIVGDRRNSLLVMATGSGKTRTAAALVDVLFKANWARRVLFLADRNALVTQAKNNFNEYLPELSAVDLTSEKENNTTRLVFSTYPTILNMIDRLVDENGRFYGVGHFDLIIVDEAHRSVYNRYQAIFEYFDALIVGLTATPKHNIDRNTFELFDCPNGDPTFSFDLQEAVPQYLVPYRNLDVSTDFLERGIRYDELSEAEKEEYEETFLDEATGMLPEEIESNAINKWLFNKDTICKVLDQLMSHGLMIEAGDKIGRTIVFAVNQKHAQFIVECFQERYPQYGPGFISTIHNKVSHAQSLIESFCDAYNENDPQIAVSVDMMDTGIDAPRVLNLVFFKQIRSYSKFWQMIGRGTRLCADLFGPNQDKSEFLIFDAGKNFEFFRVEENGKETAVSKPLSQQIFEARLRVARLQADSGKEDNLELAQSNLNTLHGQIATLEMDRFQVKMKQEFVDRFLEQNRWRNLSSDDIHIIETHLSALPVPTNEHESVRRFELMMLKTQQAHLLELTSLNRYCEKIERVARQLQGKYTIPEVRRAKPLIDQLANTAYYRDLSQLKLETIREEIRELVKYLDASGIEPVYTNFEDTEVEMVASDPLQPYGLANYRQRVESYVREHRNHLVIDKLIKNIPITEDEIQQLEQILFNDGVIGSRGDYTKEFGDRPLGSFVRSILGLDESAASAAFAELLNAGNLRADQITFLRTLIDFLTVNGTIDKGMLFASPFTDLHDQGLLGVFNDDSQVAKVIDIID